jgi:hypothetical protein
VGPRAVLDAAVKRKIPSSSRKSNPRTPIVQPIAQRYIIELSPVLHIEKSHNFKKPTRQSRCISGVTLQMSMMFLIQSALIGDE